MSKQTFKNIISLMSILIILANTIIPITFYPQPIFAQELTPSVPPPFPTDLSLEAEEDLAHRLPDGTWQALLPDSDGLYAQWLAEVPEKVVSEDEKEQLKNESIKTDSLLLLHENELDWLTYNDDNYGFTFDAPTSWDVSLSSSNRIGSVTQLSNLPFLSQVDYDQVMGTNFIKIDIGVFNKDKPEDVSLETWAQPDRDIEEQLLSQYKMVLNNRVVVRQDYSNEFQTGSILFIPDEAKIYFISVMPSAALDNNDEVSKIVNSFEIVETYPKEQKISRQLYPDVKHNAVSNSRAPSGHRLPFVGSYIITAGPGCYYTHSGRSSEAIDFALSSGTPLYTSEQGNIVYAEYGWNDGFGNLMKINHGDGYVSWYAHLDSFVKTGGDVNWEEHVAYSGNSGNSEGAHLHFEIRDSNNYSTWIRDLPGISWYSNDVNNPCQPSGYNDGVAVGPELSGDIGGKVKDVNNQPVSGATVKFSGTGINETTTTDGSGLYFFSSVPAGPATITAVKNNAGGSTDVNVLANQSQSAPDIFLDACVESRAGASLNECAPSDGVDSATFIADITLIDGSIVSPGQALVKTWRLQNTGSATWGNGYQLVFVGGQQMEAPSEVNIPATSPDQEVDISVNLTAPSTAGDHTGFWQLRNPQGTYFGPQIYVQIKVQAQSSYPITITADPTSPANTDSVQFYARVDNFPNFRAMRLKIDGNVVYEIGAPEFDYTWNTSDYSSGEHSIIVEVADQTDTSWAHPEIRGMTYTLEGTSNPNNHAPYAPDTSTPADWHVYYSGNTAQLCAENNGDPDGDPITEYYFDIYDSAELWNSGWIGSNCVTTSALGPHGYQWRVKVRDGYGAESGWSDSWHFTLVNPVLSITDFYFEPQDADSEQVKIRACTDGQGGVNITMRVSVNDANDGSSNGQWRIFYELGVPCFNETDAPIWRTLPYEDGQHLIRVEAHGGDTGWDGAAVAEQIYTLPHRRPDGPILTAPRPLSGNWRELVYLDSRTVTFKWESRVNVNQYTLYVSDSPAPRDDPTPIFQETFGSGITEYTVTFAQDYATLYWQVETTNDKGSNASGDQLFGIDRQSPLCTIEALPGTTYESVFQVNWVGTDNLAGVSSFDIQYLDSERGEWSDWLIDIPSSNTYELFTGKPGHTYYFRCRAQDNANNSSAYPATADTFTLIDPGARPPSPWWNAGYSLKRNLIIQNNDSDLLPVHFPVHLHFDATTTPTAAEIYNNSLAATKGDDVRIVYEDQLELDRFIQRFTASQIDIWIPLQVELGSGNTDDTHYQIYYGNASANTPPANVNMVFPPEADGNTVGLWHFQEGTGNMVYDSSGRNHNGSFSNSSWADGFTGWAGAFNGSNTSVSIGHSDDFNTNQLTVEAWVYVNVFDGQWHPVVIKRVPYNPGGFEFRFSNDREIIFLVDLTTGNWDIRSTALEAGRWYHVAGVFNGSNQGCIYVNGVQSRCRELTPGQLKFNTGPVTIGYSHEGGGDKYFPGFIQHVRISNIARTNFPYAKVDVKASVAVGTAIEPPVAGSAELAFNNLAVYPNPDGGLLIQAIIENQGERDTQNGFFTDLYVDHLPTGGGDYTGSLQFWVNDPIEAGTSVTLTTVITDWGTSSNLMLSSMTAGSELSGTLYGQVDSSGVISETNNNNNIYSTGIEICLASADAYEDDETYSSASLIALQETQAHNFDHLSDEDWIRFEAQGGITYTLQTSNLGASTDSYMYLYDTDGTTLLTSNDDYEGSLASYIEWTAPTTGTYYVLIRHWNPNVGGCSTSYNFSVAIYTQPEAMVTITTNPDSVMIESGGYQAVDYTFSESGGTGVVITKREAWFELVDGSELLSDKIGPYGNNIEITPYGTTHWTDNVYLPPAVVENAQAYNASTIALRTIYYGVDDYSREVSYVAVLHINIPFQVFLPIIIR